VQDKRSSQRQETATLFAQIKQRAPNFFAVYDNDNSELIGHLADLSVTGMRVVSREALWLDQTFAIRIDLPREVRDRTEIRAVAKVIWSKPHETNGLFDLGFHFQQVSEDDTETIEQLLSILSILVLNSSNT
jgi:c-di-GMP-binding flagellar brake protein YcgR